MNCILFNIYVMKPGMTCNSSGYFISLESRNAKITKNK